MTIKQHGGVFGRNPTFNDVTVDGDLSVNGTLTIGGNVITGLDYEGGWNASTNTPDLTTAPPAAGKFWIVSVAGSTDLGGITNWSQGDWALYDGSAWQRVEGGTVDLTNGVTGILPIANGGTNASDASTALSNLGGYPDTNPDSFVDAAGAVSAIKADSDWNASDWDTAYGWGDHAAAGYLTAETDPVVGAVTGIVKADGAGNISAATAGTDYLDTNDIDSTVQSYDADTAKLDVAQTWTAKQTLSEAAANSYELRSSGVVTEAGTTRTLSATDNGKVIYCTSGSAVTITTASGLGAGFSCVIIQGGAGQITMSQGSGTTQVSFGSLVKTAGQYAAISVICPVADTFILAGNLGA